MTEGTSKGNAKTTECGETKTDERVVNQRQNSEVLAKRRGRETDVRRENKTPDDKRTEGSERKNDETIIDQQTDVDAVTDAAGMRTSNEKNRRPSVVLSPFFEPFVIVSPMRRTPRLLPPRSLLLSRRFPARNFLSAKPFFLPKPTGPPSPVPKVRPVSARTPRFPSDDPPPRPSPSSVNRPGAPSPQTEPLLPNPRSSPAASSFCPCPSPLHPKSRPEPRLPCFASGTTPQCPPLPLKKLLFFCQCLVKFISIFPHK